MRNWIKAAVEVAVFAAVVLVIVSIIKIIMLVASL